MKHNESQLQQQCVAWFRAQYPQYAMLLTHVANEGNGNHVTGAIHKAEGTVAGVPDLLLFMPAWYVGDGVVNLMAVLGIEFKTPTGKQSQQQKDYQRMFEAAGNKYVIVRSFEDFRREVNSHISNTLCEMRKQIASTHVEIEKEKLERERARLQKIIKK